MYLKLKSINAKDYWPILHDIMSFDNMYLIKYIFDMTKTNDLIR